LIGFVKSKTGIKVDYSPSNELMVFEMPNGGAEVSLLGELAQKFNRKAATLGISRDQAMEEALRMLFEKFQEWERTGFFTVKNPETGVLEKRKMTSEELGLYIAKELE
jgi:hypothetical protein